MASLTRLRKRPRVASVAKDSGSDDDGGGVFAERSDSESEDTLTCGSSGKVSSTPATKLPGNSATLSRNLTAAEQQSQSQSQDANDEDSLDAFMNEMNTSCTTERSLTSASRVRELTPCSSRSASPERPSIQTDARGVREGVNEEKSAEEIARNAERERRSLNLCAVDHSKVKYGILEKTLYTGRQVDGDVLRTEATSAGLSLSGAQVCPIESFTEVDSALPESVIRGLLSDFTSPTAVQRGVVPAALAGHDVLGTAPTGSGKTLAFLLPLLAHARGPARGLVLAPTRELATQIAAVACKYGGRHCAACITGGMDKYTQVNAVRRAKLWVATPGRLIDLIKARATRMRAVTAVAIDEADRMLDLGFESQVRSILAQIRPDALRMMLSATMPARVSALARDVLHDPAVIAPLSSASNAKNSTPSARTATSTGDEPARVADGVREHYVHLGAESERWVWLHSRLPELMDGVHGDGGGGGLVVVFCRTRGAAAALANRLRASDIPAACVHGETDADDRDALIEMFRRGDVRVLVSTDLAARGLHIDGVAAVVNYEPAKDWDWHVHRVGRTGRAGAPGDAYTLLVHTSSHDVAFATKARSALRAINVQVPNPVNILAENAPIPQRGRWKRTRSRNNPRDPNPRNHHHSSRQQQNHQPNTS